MPRTWTVRKLAPIEREVAALKVTVIQLRHELTNTRQAAGALRHLVRARNEQVDALGGRLEQSQRQIRELNEEADHLVTIIRSAEPQRLYADPEA
jgi:chromosome segregation ATPase